MSERRRKSLLAGSGEATPLAEKHSDNKGLAPPLPEPSPFAQQLRSVHLFCSSDSDPGSRTENHRNATSYYYIHNALVYGFELYYSLDSLDDTEYWAKVIIDIGLLGMVMLIFRAPCVGWLLILKWWRRNLSMYSAIEDFLQGNHSFIPIRYSYLDIKKMTNRFKDKLSEGGYGCVFKGNLRNGRFGAIKMLGKSKANGQDFVSEVATIGRIHHVNVVQLAGYCVEGSNHCLDYDFMPNGSLDKYVYLKEGTTHLSYEKMYQISLIYPFCSFYQLQLLQWREHFMS